MYIYLRSWNNHTFYLIVKLREVLFQCYNYIDKELIKRMNRHWMLFVVTLLTLTATVRSTLISNLDLVFETFNPISMVRFFEFNDKGWNISTGCIQDMFLYLDGLHKDVLWALKRKHRHRNSLFFSIVSAKYQQYIPICFSI